MLNHIIHKQQVYLNVAKREDSFNYQNRISALFRNELQGRLNVLFNEVASMDEVVRFDTLRLQLGTIDPNNFDHEFTERFLVEIEKEIVKRKQEIIETRRELLAGKRKRVEEGSAIIVTRAKSLRNTLIHFLQFGTLPWYSVLKKTAELEAQIAGQFAAEDWKTIATTLRKIHVQNPVICQRLALQFSDAFLEKLLAEVIEVDIETLRSSIRDTHYLLVEFLELDQAETRNKIWEVFLEDYLFQQATQPLSFSLIKLFVIKLSTRQLENFTLEIKDLSKKIETESVRVLCTNLMKLVAVVKQKNIATGTRYVPGFSNVSNAVLFDLLSGKNGEQERWKDYDDKYFFKDLMLFEEEYKNSQGQDKKTVEKSRHAQSISPEDSFRVFNSGLVLLHPFLEAYYTELGLMFDKQFLNEGAHSRAVLLFNYLGSGCEEAAEFELTLPKIMCGFSLEETLPAKIELTESEKEESAKLLQAVADHWPPLKNTSASGLQASFLQREGKLTLKDSGWLLIVEQKTIDVLLGKLPWGFSTIRLHWMKEMVSVDWC